MATGICWLFTDDNSGGSVRRSFIGSDITHHIYSADCGGARWGTYAAVVVVVIMVKLWLYFCAIVYLCLLPLPRLLVYSVSLGIMLFHTFSIL